MKKSFLMIMLLVLCHNAKADWVSVSSDETRTIYADPATTIKNGNMVEMWGLFDFKATHFTETKKSYKSLKFRDEFDCEGKRSRNLYISIQSEDMGNGEKIADYSDPSNWLPIGGMRTLLWKLACPAQ